MDDHRIRTVDHVGNVVEEWVNKKITWMRPSKQHLLPTFLFFFFFLSKPHHIFVADSWMHEIENLYDIYVFDQSMDGVDHLSNGPTQMTSFVIGSDGPPARPTRLKPYEILKEETLFIHGPWESRKKREWSLWKNPVHRICPRGMWGPPWERAHGGSLAYTCLTWKEWSMHALELLRHM